MNELNDVLLTQHIKITSEFQHPEEKRIRKGVEYVTEQLVYEIHKADDRFDLEILRSGSYYEGLKISVPNEFDFMLQSKELTDAFRTSNAKIRPSGFRGSKNLWRTPRGSTAFKKIQLLEAGLIDRWKDLLSKINTNNRPEYLLDAADIKIHLCKLVDNAIRKISLPRLFDIGCHPSFNAASIAIGLIWNGRHFKDFKVSFDLTFCIHVDTWLEESDIPSRLPVSHTLFAALSDITANIGYHLIPVVKANGQSLWRISTSVAESALLDSVKNDDSCKALIRICKYQRDAIYSEKHGLISMQTEADDYDWAARSPYLMSTYVIKNIVFKLMEKTDSELAKTESLAHRYIDYLFELHDCLKKGYVENFFLPAHKISVSHASYDELL